MMREGVAPFDTAIDQRDAEKTRLWVQAMVSFNTDGDIDTYCFRLSKTEAQKLIAELSKKHSGQEDANAAE